MASTDAHVTAKIVYVAAAVTESKQLNTFACVAIILSKLNSIFHESLPKQ